MSTLLRAILGMTGAAGAGTIPDPSSQLIHYWEQGDWTDDGSTVSAWNDSGSTGGRSFAEGTYKPALISGGINSLDSVRFDGSNDMLNESSGSLSQGFQLFFVAKVLTHTSGRILFGESGNVNNPDLKMSTSPNIVGPGSGPSKSISASTWELYAWWCNGTSTVIRVAGVDSSSGGTVTSAFTGGTALANRGGTAWGNVEFAELAMYSGRQTGTNLTSIESYFNTKFGL